MPQMSRIIVRVIKQKIKFAYKYFQYVMSASNMKGKHVFVTVGTTKFEKLIAAASSKEVLDVLSSLGFNSVQFQIGTGTCKEEKHEKVVLKYEKYFENFWEEIEKSDLIISHAGAGSCLEVLRKKKPLIVVINEDLMDNHQEELAEHLQNSGYLYFCNCDSLKDTLLKDFNSLKSYPTPDQTLFSKYLDKCMGFE